MTEPPASGLQPWLPEDTVSWRDRVRQQDIRLTLDTKRRVIRIALFSAAVQTVVKGAAGITTGSLAVLGLAADSFGDFLNLAVARISITLGGRPPDREHPFGHGKIEPLGALLQAGALVPIIYLLVVHGVRRLTGEPVVALPVLGIAALAGSILLGVWTARHLTRTAASTDSVVLHASSLSFRIDAVTHGGVIIALVAVWLTGRPEIDAIATLLVAGWVLIAVGDLLSRALADLLDRQLPETWRERVETELEEHLGEFVDYHRLRTRKAGSEKHIDLHLTICRYRTLEESHRLADHLETALEAIVPNSHVIIHVDPCEPGRTCPSEAVCDLAGERKGVIPESNWPDHPIGAQARDRERRQHGG
jgi:ferrous-iron efflux pump FieF